MSIYGTIPGIGDPTDGDHESGPPWIYQGSHILPAEDHPRGGSIGLAEIPSHITRDGRDEQPEDGRPWSWLRMSIDAAPQSDDPSTVLLTPVQARALAAQLTAWADEVQQATTASPTSRAWHIDIPVRGEWQTIASGYTSQDGAHDSYQQAVDINTTRPVRLVRATTTYAVEAEHTPDGT